MTATTELDTSIQTLFSIVGSVVVQWAQAEQSLELVIDLLYDRFGGKAIAGKAGMPKMLGPKLKFFRRCLQQLPAIADLRERGEALADMFETLSPIRHSMVHGCVSSLMPIADAYTFVRLNIVEDEHVPESYALKIDAFPKLTKDLVALAREAPDFGHALAVRLP